MWRGGGSLIFNKKFKIQKNTPKNTCKVTQRRLHNPLVGFYKANQYTLLPN